MTGPRPLILTPGEPGGIGPEIAIKAWQELRNEQALAFALLCDIDHLKSLAGSIGLQANIIPVAALADCKKCFAQGLPILHRPLRGPVSLGTFSPDNALWVLACIDEAVAACLSCEAAAMATAPIQKEALYAAGFRHQGHTDYLAHLARQAGHEASEVMMLVGGGLRAVPLTVHIPLQDVHRELTRDVIVRQARVVAGALKEKFGISRPRLAITGLNPHAGENGSMGREEIDVIIPALGQLRAEGLQIAGPLPADTAFIPEMRGTYDAVLCMYHDQALIPVKALDFHGGVNVTLGLPFIRTSPDHGTALGLAGKGTARPQSLIAAIKLAAAMALGTAGG